MQHVAGESDLIGDVLWRGRQIEFEDVGVAFEVDLAQLIHVGAAIGVPPGRIVFANERSDALPACDVALIGQVGQCPPDGDAGDAELIAQLLFSGQGVPRRDGPAGDLVVQHQEQLPMQRHARHQRNGLAADVIPAHRNPHRTVVIDVPPRPSGRCSPAVLTCTMT